LRLNGVSSVRLAFAPLRLILKNDARSESWRAPDAVGIRSGWAVVIATLAIQAALQSYFFPLPELLSATPLYYIDSPFHQYQMEVARSLCGEHRLVGYDPFFAAGYLGGVTYNASAKLPALLACMVGTPDAVVPIFKIFSFAMGVLAPAAVVVAAVLLRFDARALWIAAGFALVSWWTGPMRWYHTAGLISYVATAYWAIAFAAAVSCTCRAPTVWRMTAVALAAAVGVLVHPLFAVAAILLCAPLLLGDLQGHGGIRRIAVLALCASAAVLLVNLPWLHATLSAPNFVTGEQQPYQRLVDPWLVFREPLGIAATASGGSRLYLAFLAGAIAAVFTSKGPSRRPLLALTVSAVLLMGWASLGGLSGTVGALQPNRFSALAWLVLALPAAWGTARMYVYLLHGAGTVRAWAGVGLLLVAAVSALLARDAVLEIFSQRSARYAVTRPEVKGEGDFSRRLESWIRTNTDPSARIYFETSLGRVHDHAHMAGIYSLHTGREFIGGPYPFTDFASAWDGFGFGRPLRNIPPAELTSLLDRYNVRWMVCHSADCRSAMEAVSDATRVEVIAPVSIYARRSTSSYFLEGAGTVRSRCINRLDVELASAGDVVLKYHWTPGLVAEPEARIEPRFVGDDPRPFIAVIRPASRFALGLGRPGPACEAHPAGA
jgi:hypothetical protein